jgi:hypothetical protein
MRSVDYQQRMVECSKRAATAPNLQARLVWKRMEEFWRQRAVRPGPPKTPDVLTFMHEELTSR